ncbi:hypothetical protein FOZ61_005531 [Perkinsus olseni]|uniref:SET domain-containing protein n=1 Tax=Perkinsus olseni TaxID=32597 RepID=A0A7J6LGY8_PEROL|nr:hypothetical protein FOZ61_005531 [Perkinsus olseni]
MRDLDEETPGDVGEGSSNTAVHATPDSTEPVCGEDWSDARIAARVEVRDTTDKGRCMFSRMDEDDVIHPGEIVFAESPLQIVTPDTCPILYEWLKEEEASVSLELPIVWHMAALSSLLFLHEDKLVRCYDKWAPPVDAPTNESQGEPSSNYPNCQHMLHTLVHGHVEAIPKDEREVWMWKLIQLDTRDYVHLLLIWRFNSFGHHTVADGLIMYDKISMLSHSCEATCCWHYGPNDSFVLRARVPIEPGDELTISYIGDEELFKSTNIRRQRLQGWLFTCHCHRCDEPVDYARGFRCTQCHTGVVYPCTEWKDGSSPISGDCRASKHCWCTSPCTFCRTRLNESDMEELEDLERQYDERLAVTEADDEADIQLVYSEGAKVFSRGCHWILHQMDVWLAAICREKSDWLGAAAHQKDKADRFLSRVTPLANYSYAWCFEEIADTYLNLIGATSASLITKAACNQMLALYERSFYMLTVLCGSEHTFTQSALSKWSNIRSIIIGIESEPSPATAAVETEAAEQQLSSDIDVVAADGDDNASGTRSTDVPTSSSAAAAAASDTKVSKRATSEALFLECLDEIRKSRCDTDPDIHTRPAIAIEKLTQEETELTRKLFYRLDEFNDDETPQKREWRVAQRQHKIDPYWDPFVTQLDHTKDKLLADFEEYARVASAAEAKRTRVAIRKSLLQFKLRYDSYSKQYRKWLNRGPAEEIPKPHKMEQSFWEPSPLQKQLAREQMHWRNVDVLQHYRAQNGYIHPRRVTMLSRKKQAEMVKAVCRAEVMCVAPYDWVPKVYHTFPIMDPVQWLVYRLSRLAVPQPHAYRTDPTSPKPRVSQQRADAMLQVLSTKIAPELDYSYWLREKQRREEGKLQHEDVYKSEGVSERKFDAKLREFRRKAGIPERRAVEEELKIIIIGDAGSGKSCIIRQFLEGVFSDESEHTIGVEFASKVIKVNSKRVKLQIWDTAGQQRYRTVTRSYYRGAAGVVLLYDITSRESYNHLPGWLQDARNQTGQDDLSVVILGNKKDLGPDQREVSFLEASRFAQENSVLFMETSAATGEGVQEVFRTLTTRVLNRIDEGLLDPRSIMIPASSSSPPPAREDSEQQQHDSSDTNTTGVMHWCLPASLMVCWLHAEERREDDTPMKRMGVDGGMDDDGVVG